MKNQWTWIQIQLTGNGNKKNPIYTENTELEDDQQPKQSSPLTSTLRKAVDAKDWKLLGKLIGEEDKRNDNPLAYIIDIILSMVYFHDPVLSQTKIPIPSWKDFTLGYCEGYGCSDEETEMSLKSVEKFIQHHELQDHERFWR